MDEVKINQAVEYIRMQMQVALKRVYDGHLTVTTSDTSMSDKNN